MQHRTQTDLEQAEFRSTGRIFNTPDGYYFGWGTTVGNGVEDWANGAFFIDSNAADGQQLNRNDGTKTTASWTTIAGLSSSPTVGIGYATGAGGAVTQITSITTGVTLSKVTGTITTVSSTLIAGADATFTVTNTVVAATDLVVCSTKSYGGTADGIPICNVEAVAAGSFDINIRNTGAVTLDALVVISFAVIKGVAA